MKLYNWIASLFGISGWVFSLYIWKKYGRTSAKIPPPKLHGQEQPKEPRVNSEERSQTPLSRQPNTDAYSSAPMPIADLDLIHIEAANKDTRIQISGRSKVVVACLILLLAAILVYALTLRKNKSESKVPSAGITVTTGDISFIKIVSELRTLPEKPDWKTITINTAVDGTGIEVVLGVLWDPYRWVKADAATVAIDQEEKMRYNIEEVVRAFQDDEERPILVVGMASHENARENPEEEINRAADRADKLVDVCSRHFRNKPHIYSLNLGAFKPTKNPSRFSASERRVVFLVITRGENNADLTGEVKKALIKAKTESNFIFDARDYSLFDTDRFRVHPRANF